MDRPLTSSCLHQQASKVSKEIRFIRITELKPKFYHKKMEFDNGLLVFVMHSVFIFISCNLEFVKIKLICIYAFV
jgi:hypothetical protein